MEGTTCKQLFLKSKQEAGLLIASSKFQEEIRKSRKILDITQKGFKTDKEKIEWQNKTDFYSSLSLKTFNKILINLRIKFKLSNKWEDFLKHYILYNKIRILGGGFTIKVELDKNTNKEEICLKINKQTTLKDIVRRWYEVKSLQKRVFRIKDNKRFKEIKKLERNKRILELTDQEFKDKKIAKKINEEFNEILIYSDIPKIRNRFKKKLHHS